ncbi:DUF2514 family protein, partial [Klebsiella pneumoniae]
LQRADKKSGELAVAYDRARIAGLACERSYDAIRSKQHEDRTKYRQSE